MKLSVLAFLIGLVIPLQAQDFGHSLTIAEATVAGSSYRGTLSLSTYKNFQFGRERRIGVGLGLRYSGFLGANLYYITAPAELTSGSTGPLVIFKENIEQNIDSLLVKSPQVNALNLAINLCYRISPSVILGFNIDAIGFSFGAKTRANYINGVEGKNTMATPTSFNILLISDNDRGSLNSELYVRYRLNEKLDMKAAGQFLFTEYTTETDVQQYPEPNDRFRNKSLLFGLGVVYKINEK